MMSTSLLDFGPTAAANVLETAPESANVHENGGTAVRFVTFFYGENLYGIKAEDVAEVTQPLPVSPLPNCPDALSGISPLRGEIVAVVDLRKMLRESASLHQSRSKFVILRGRLHETPIAFKVDRMHELVAADEDAYSPSRGDNPVLSGMANVAGRTVGIISGEALRDALGV